MPVRAERACLASHRYFIDAKEDFLRRPGEANLRTFESSRLIGDKLLQVLYIESLMRSAEIKYMSCVALIRTWLNSASFTAEGNAGKYGEVVALLCAALMNAATCRSARELRPKTYAPLETCVASLLSLLPDVETLCKLPPLALADMALDANRICAKEAGQPYSDIVLSLKKCLLLERNGNM